MRSRYLSSLTILLVFASGCGSNAISGQGAASGNWAIYAVDVGPSTMNAGSQIPVVGGSLSFSAGSASANFYAPGSSCFSTGNLAFSGSLTNSSLKLTSAAENGQVITMTGALSTNGASISNGTFTIAGGCANSLTGYFQGVLMPSMTGTWSGSAIFNAPPITPLTFQATVTLQLQQSSTPTDFWFPSSGMIQIAGSPCGFSSGTLVQNILLENVNAFESSVAGYDWWAAALMDDGSQVQITGNFPTGSPASSQTTFTISGGKCDGYTAVGATLTGP